MAGDSPLPEPKQATEHALAELSRIPAEASLDAVFALACKLSADAVDVERVGVWLFIDQQTALRCAHLFERSKGEHSKGVVLQVADFPRYFASLKSRKSVPAEVAAEEPWTAELAEEYLTPLGITSMLDAGIFVDGEMVGVVCHEHVGPPREWTHDARAFANAVAGLLAVRIQAAEARELRLAFKRQQKRLAAQAKVAAMEELTAGIAHDYKNLLMTIRIYGRLLNRRGDLPADAREHAQEIVTAADRGTELARELMEFARPEFAPPAVIDLAEATAECLPTLQGIVGTNHEVRYIGSTSVGRVLMEKSQFVRLLVNAVSNAREAMPNGGVVKIRLAPVRVRGNGHNSGRFVLVEIADKGVGMDEATLRRLFEPYFTTKPKGTGLGMPIVQRILDRIGGFVRVESAPGAGTTVRMYFPSFRAVEGPKGETAAAPSEESA